MSSVLVFAVLEPIVSPLILFSITFCLPTIHNTGCRPPDQIPQCHLKWFLVKIKGNEPIQVQGKKIAFSIFYIHFVPILFIFLTCISNVNNAVDILAPILNPTTLILSSHHKHKQKLTSWVQVRNMFFSFLLPFSLSAIFHFLDRIAAKPATWLWIILPPPTSAQQGKCNNHLWKNLVAKFWSY